MDRSVLLDMSKRIKVKNSFEKNFKTEKRYTQEFYFFIRKIILLKLYSALSRSETVGYIYYMVVKYDHIIYVSGFSLFDVRM